MLAGLVMNFSSILARGVFEIGHWPRPVVPGVFFAWNVAMLSLPAKTTTG